MSDPKTYTIRVHSVTADELSRLTKMASAIDESASWWVTGEPVKFELGQFRVETDDDGGGYSLSEDGTGIARSKSWRSLQRIAEALARKVAP